MIDTHVHVIDASRFPPPDGPGTKPRPDERATAADLAGTLAEHGVAHAVVVQLSGYGIDNRCILDAVARSRGRWRAIVSLPPDVGAGGLDELAAAGAVGGPARRPDPISGPVSAVIRHRADHRPGR